MLTSLFGSLHTPVSSTSSVALDPLTRVFIKREAAFLDDLVGKLTPESDRGGAELWEIATSLMLSKDWPGSCARIFVCWVSGGSVGTVVNLKGRRVELLVLTLNLT